MKREEKNQQSRKKIMEAALREFGEKSYGEASLNTICREGDISKGIIYHYFKDKDELYLACLQECFDALTSHLRGSTAAEDEEIEIVLQRYFDTRMIFFGENPNYFKLFCSAVMAPPPHLIAEIGKVRRDFDGLNRKILTALLQRVPLRSGLSIDEAVDEFKLYQDFVNTQSFLPLLRQEDIDEHESRCSHTLKTYLYGIIERS